MSRWKLHLPTLSLGRAVDGATQLGSLRWAESSFWAEIWDSKAGPNGQKKKLSQNDHGDGSKRMAQDRREIDSACLVVKNHFWSQIVGKIGRFTMVYQQEFWSFRGSLMIHIPLHLKIYIGQRAFRSILSPSVASRRQVWSYLKVSHIFVAQEFTLLALGCLQEVGMSWWEKMMINHDKPVINQW